MLAETAFRLLALIALFGAVVILIDLGTQRLLSRRAGRRAVNQRLRMIEGGVSRLDTMERLRRRPIESGPAFLRPFAAPLHDRLVRAGVTRPTMEVLSLLIVAPLVLLMLLATVFGGAGLGAGRLMLLLAVALALGVGIPLYFLARKAERRRRKMEEQFPVALDVFVRGLRAGHPVAAALDLLTVEMPDPVGSQFGLVVDEVTYGADLRDALEDMADRWDLDDLRMFVVCLSVQSETGGNLAEILDNLGRVIRERHSLFRKVRALSSEGRMSAWMLTALPVLTFLLIFLTRPSFYLDVSDDPFFIPGFGILLFIFATGVWIIRRMVDLKV